MYGYSSRVQIPYNKHTSRTVLQLGFPVRKNAASCLHLAPFSPLELSVYVRCAFCEARILPQLEIRTVSLTFMHTYVGTYEKPKFELSPANLEITH